MILHKSLVDLINRELILKCTMHLCNSTMRKNCHLDLQTQSQRHSLNALRPQYLTNCLFYEVDIEKYDKIIIVSGITDCRNKNATTATIS